MEQGRDTLAWDPELSTAACAHTRDMLRRDFFRHKNPDGERPDERVARLHRRLIGGVGENLYGQQGVRKEGAALGAKMVEEWMNSPTHRKNILRPGVNHLGVCALREQNTVRATQLFAKVYAYLSNPLPKTVTRGQTLSVSIEQTFPPDAAVVRYDFWDPRAKQKIGGTHVLNDSLFIPDTTGIFRTRFYILEKGEYTARPGPQVTITSPPSQGKQ